MDQISPPMRIVLAVAVVFLAAWMLVLKPKDDTSEPVATPSTPAPTTASSGFTPTADCADPLVECACDHDPFIDCDGNPRVTLTPTSTEPESTGIGQIIDDVLKETP